MEMDKMMKRRQRVIWGRMKWKQKVICRVCGATRDYIERTENGFKCTLCGSRWHSLNEVGA